MSTIKGRIEGNQLNKKFTENVNLNIGLDASVLNIGSAKVRYNYKRRWYFEVEFYDKSSKEFTNQFDLQTEIDQLSPVEKELLERFKVVYEDRKKSKPERVEIENFCIKNNISKEKSDFVENLYYKMLERKQSFFSKIFGGFFFRLFRKN